MPQALVNRPNVVTKVALVEQAYALAEHEITLFNYDAAFCPESSSATASTSSSSALSNCIASASKDRILRHHAKQCSALQMQRTSKHQQQQISTTNTANSQQPQQQTHTSPNSPNVTSSGSFSATPSPQLVAALRQIYGNTADETPALSFRSLLKAVMDHKVFQIPSSKTTSTGDSSREASSSSSPEGPAEGNQSDDEPIIPADATCSNAKAPLAQVEALLANVCRLVDDKEQSSTSMIQGLLIAALFILTQMPTRTNETEATINNNHNKGRENSPKGRTMRPKPNKKSVTEDPLVSPAILVGSILPMLQLSDNHKASSGGEAADFQLDPELLQYFADAAAAYEGRTEIQKARLLAKMQKGTDLPPAETISEPPAADAGENPVTPVALPSADVNNSDNVPTHFTDQVAILEGEAPLERLAEATAETLEQIISAATGDESSSEPGAENEEDDEDNDNDVFSGSGSCSDSDGNNSDGYQDDAEEQANVEAVSPADEEEANVEAVSPADEEGAQENNEEAEAEDDDDDDESSSSSSSADAWAMMQEQAGAESQDEEDDDVLQQALALSLSDHDATTTTGGAAANSETDNQASGMEQNSSEERREETQAGSTAGEDPSASAGPEIPPSERSDIDVLSAGITLSEEPTKSESEEADDDLPPLPKPPSVQPYASLLGQPVEIDSDQAVSIESAFAPYFEPSALTTFGSIPTANVLVYLLRFTVEFIEMNKFANSTAAGSKDFSKKSTDDATHAVPGGMGLSLFPPRKKHPGFNTGRERGANLGENAGPAVTLQLLVAFFLQIMEKRNDAIAGLKKAIAQEERHAQGEEIGDDNTSVADDDKTNATPLSSEEEDDPAIAFAMNYAQDIVAESSESLEAKGMMRKAAAAAYDAAELLKLLRRRTDAWKHNVRLYSHCAIYALRSLRKFLQSMVRERLSSLQQEPTQSPAATIDFSEFIPSLVGSKLSMSLASLWSVNAYNSFASMLNGDGAEINSVFLSLPLYREAMTTWGECVPLVYPSVSAQVEVLRGLISECSSKPGSDVNTANVRNLDSLVNMPTAECEPLIHRLQMLCKRLRVTDLLDNLVPSPACYVPKADDPDSSHSSPEGTVSSSNIRDPFRASAITSLIGTAAKDSVGGRGELQKLFLALCHRFHARVLLWGGLFECTENDVDDVAGAAATPMSAGTDLVRIAANPSNQFLFDSTKCSDSIAILSNAGESTAGTNGSSVHQRASKVWGTVLSTHQFSPKTGVHKWAVRLDKCERGHVFVGVATAQASMRTYVGGDKYGWGMIGTQALWHDRRKVRIVWDSTTYV